MTPLELSYPIIGFILALGGGVYGWQSRRQLAQATAALKTQQAALSQPQPPVAKMETTIVPAPSEALVHLQGKLRHLEQDLAHHRVTLQTTLAARDELAQDYQAQEKVLATLRQQLTQQQTAEGDRLKGLQQQNQELLQENSNLSDRLRQSVNSLAEARPKLVQFQAMEAKNQQLSEQLQQVNQHWQTEMTQQLAERDKTWQHKNLALTAQVSQLEQQIQQLTAQREQAQQDVRTLNEQETAAQAQVKTLTASLQDLTRSQQDWQQEREQLNAKLSNLEATQKSLALTNQELTIKLEATQAQGDRLKAEKKEQGLALQLAQGEVAKLQQQLADLAQAQGTVQPEAEPALIPEPEPTDDLPESVVVEPMVEAEPAVEVAAKISEPVAEPVADRGEPRGESPSEPDVPANANPMEAHSFADKKIVILGTLNSMNREAAKTRLQELGAECTSTPSSKTDYVIVGKAPGVKLKKAQKLGIPQLSEAQFLEMLGE